ncbi:myrosinase 1-like [Spodoptera litura]|uniref:Myrosinase 1-like n=1 Tax=Spodoptera litura TaxID=69820 RepID=A0A9J7ILT1_SPOLT|nr:myrosinase 1-like [Spodoptera litura]
MYFKCAVVLTILIHGAWSATEQLKFPETFMFGAASAAYQIEGAWNVSDKSLSIWDKLLHDRPELVVDHTNGDVACDSYHLWRRDIEMLQELGLNMYRFSISWPRLLPTGFSNYVSEDGKNYYNNLIDGLLEKGIQPLVTIYHFDLPQSLQDLGGWANPLITDWFADYANVVFSLYGDRVKYWVTINEPMGLCDGGYGQFSAPYFNDTYVGQNLCNKNTMIAHAKAYRIYDELYRDKYHGKLSLSTLFFWFKPVEPEDQEVTDLTIDLWAGRYTHPIFSKEGGWPRKLEQLLNENAKKQGYHYRLPPFTPEEIELVRGTYDYYALNHYTTRLVRRAKPREKAGSWFFDGSPELNVIFDKDPRWRTTGIDWFAFYSEGLREQLHWLNTTYDIKEIVITENGIPTLDDGLVDILRLDYYKEYLEQILLAINDGINVTGYAAWTLMDNFEWMSGYFSKFGLYAVDFTHPNRTRTPKESARYYSQVTRTRMVHPVVDETELNYVK